MRTEKDTSKPRNVIFPAKAVETGYVSEMFCSVQGEGLFVGERQLFLRTAGCKATCYWCDTPASKVTQEQCVIHGDEKQVIANPVAADHVVEVVMQLAKELAPVRTVSLTGGEPLEQADFVATVAKALRKRKMRIYLETSGLEVDGFRRVRPFVDVVAADIKLPSATGHEHWDVHREFVKWLVGTKGFVKVVIDATTPLQEIDTAIHMIAEIDRTIPLVLQPESTTYIKGDPENRQRLARLLEQGQRAGLECLRDVRVIPQCHKFLKVR